VIRKSSLSLMAPFEDLTIVAYTTLGGMPDRRENSFKIRESANGLSLQNGTGFEQLIKLEARQ
jgi:hypothetical protein